MASSNDTISSSATQMIFDDIENQLRHMRLGFASTSTHPTKDRASSNVMKDNATKQKLATITEQVETTEQVPHDQARIASSVYSRSASGCLSEDESSVNEEDARFEAWLERGSRTTTSSDSDSTLSLSAFPMIETNYATTKFSLSPKISAGTESVCYGSSPTPLSPLNNGRDIYGNYIATNPLDYFTAQSPPSSPIISAISPNATADHDTPMPQLRGGGGSWWENLGVHNKTAQTSAAQSNDQSNNHKIPPNIAELPGSPVEDVQNSRVRQSIPISPGTRPLTNKLSNYGRSDVPTREGPISPLFNADRQASSLQDASSGSIMSNLAPPPALFGDQYRPASASGQSFTTISSYNRTPRAEKRWDKGKARQPPGISPPPAILEKSSRRSQTSSYAGPSAPRYNNSNKRRQAMSPDDSFSQARPPTTAFDIDSLHFGESASAGPWQRLPQPPRPHPKSLPPRQGRPQGMYIQPNDQQTEEEFEAYTQAVEAEFRVRAHEIMTRYNMDKAREWKALQGNVVSQEQYDRDVDRINEEMLSNLKRAEVDTGYAILNDEAAIAEAIKTANGYTIYQDILKPTQPDLWTRLEVSHPQPPHVQSFHPHLPTHHNPQHLLNQANQTNQTPHVLHHQYSSHVLVPGMPFKPPKSSLTQSISAAGKIARFLFAAPADPDLKTFSNKRPMAVGLGAVGGVVTGATEFGNPSDQMSRKERRKEQLGQLGGGKKKKDKDKDKDKNRASSTEPIRNGSYTVPQVFASSPAVSQAGPARSQAISAVPSTRYTGTTAVPSMYPPLSPTAPSFLARPYSPFASEVGSRSDAATTATDVTSWPEADSQGNWATGRRPVARGDRMGRKEDFRAGSSEFGRALHMR